MVEAEPIARSLSFAYTTNRIELPIGDSSFRRFKEWVVNTTACPTEVYADYIQLWKDVLSKNFFVDSRNLNCTPINGVVGLVEAIAWSEPTEILIITPFDHPEFIDLIRDFLKVYVLHTSASNHWKITAQHLETGCRENANLTEGALIY